MDLVFTPEQDRFREEVREFLAATVTPELLARTKGAIEAYVPEFYQQVAERGWIGLQWPKEFGGQDRSPIDMGIFYEEMGLALAPLGRYVGTTVFVGGSVIHYGNREQQTRYLQKIAKGDWLASFALTEPDAGSDAASITSSGVRDGDEWVLNGEKVFISGADLADCILTAVRTDPEAPVQQQGISLFLVRGDAPGLEIRPIKTVAGLNVNTVTYDNVRVPAIDMLGNEGQGWKHIQTTFSLERSLSSAQLVGSLIRLYDDVMAFASAEVAAGRMQSARVEPLYDVRAELESARLMSYRAMWLDEHDGVPLDEAATSKLTRSELALKLATTGMELLGERTLVTSENSFLGGRLEALYRRVQFYITAGGTNDIQRGILAQQGLGLPRR